eukprot:760639-Hanusia_phi.AAC.3
MLVVGQICHERLELLVRQPRDQRPLLRKHVQHIHLFLSQQPDHSYTAVLPPLVHLHLADDCGEQALDEYRCAVTLLPLARKLAALRKRLQGGERGNELCVPLVEAAAEQMLGVVNEGEELAYHLVVILLTPSQRRSRRPRFHSHSLLLNMRRRQVTEGKGVRAGTLRVPATGWCLVYDVESHRVKARTSMGLHEPGKVKKPMSREARG